MIAAASTILVESRGSTINMDDSTSSDEFIENAELGHNNENGACNHEEEENAAIDVLEPSVGWIFPKAKVSYVHARDIFITNVV